VVAVERGFLGHLHAELNGYIELERAERAQLVSNG
jgi:hypothetical protein